MYSLAQRAHASLIGWVKTRLVINQAHPTFWLDATVGHHCGPTTAHVSYVFERDKRVEPSIIFIYTLTTSVRFLPGLIPLVVATWKSYAKLKANSVAHFFSLAKRTSLFSRNTSIFVFSSALYRPSCFSSIVCLSIFADDKLCSCGIFAVLFVVSEL